MKFLKISYQNYRCFKDITINFNTTSDKNISLIIAPNGGGKTEMLFSFWWVLYDFDFNSLKGKEDTPYSLNSALYLKLVDANKGEKEECSVSLEFEHNGIIYRIKRIETFFKSNTIERTQTTELAYVKPNGELSLPERDMEKVSQKLSSIIPKNILHGIIFDGERMKQLSSVDENSKTAVEGVIRDITNEELFELCKNEFEELNYINNSILRKIAKKLKNANLEKIVQEIEKYESELKYKETALKAKKDSLVEVKNELSLISLKLKENETSKKFEEQRIKLKASLEQKNKELEVAINDFRDSLYYGYLLVGDKLFNDANDLLQQHDMPAGLVVEAVENIMKRDKCICGHTITEVELGYMRSLLQTLPPNNINSTIAEMIRQTKMSIEFDSEKLLKSYQAIDKLESEIKEMKNELAFVSTQITSDAPALIVKLESDYKEYIIKEDELESTITEYENDIKYYKGKLEQLHKDKKDSAGIDAEANFYNMKADFINKCISALKAIDEYNKKISLANINSKINEAYSILSEDYSRGRRLYIVQFDNSKKYRLVSYYESNYTSLYTKYKADGTLNAFIMQGLSENEIKEKVILKILESNSTGQSKINTLAFAKAILDYSNEERDEESTEITKNYPFMIDSPFTELSDGNLYKSAENIHLFSSQIILMISSDSLDGVKELLLPYVNNIKILEKHKNESYSFVKDGE